MHSIRLVVVPGPGRREVQVPYGMTLAQLMQRENLSDRTISIAGVPVDRANWAGYNLDTVNEVFATTGTKGNYRSLDGGSAADGAMGHALSVAKAQVLEGLKDTPAAALDEKLVQLIEAQFGKTYPAILKTAKGRAIAKIAAPMILLALVNTGVLPVDGKIKVVVEDGCARAIRTSTRDGAQPILADLMGVVGEFASFAGSEK